jgi:putative CocE/NonD family hydrolase
VLSTARATGGKPTDTYVYDPRNPVVQHDLGPVTSYSIEFGVSQDRSKIQQRNDVLVYTSAPLERQLDVLGLAEVELHAASDAKDTDFTASLTDVAPDGKAISLGHLPVGIVRARYRDGNGKGSLLQPGRPYRFKIELGHIAHSFLPGHRIRLEISSSAYPLFNPNQNTGNPIADDVEWKSARQTIYHTRAQPSALRLPALGELIGAL